MPHQFSGSGEDDSGPFGGWSGGVHAAVPVPIDDEEAARRECQHMRAADGSGCVCDIALFARCSGDWPIARAVGVATYAQLLDAGPGLFEPIPDVRSGGRSASSLLGGSFTNMISRRFSPDASDPTKSGFPGPESAIPSPPNLVSTVLAEGELSPAELKRLLIVYTQTGCADPRIHPLIGSSRAYRDPEDSLAAVVGYFALYALIVGISAALLMRLRGGEVACGLVGCPPRRFRW